ncbi:MAG TPA: DUF6797 domain-containing protein [Verrucomicrobiae bacterium]|jgi:cytochrome c2
MVKITKSLILLGLGTFIELTAASAEKRVNIVPAVLEPTQRLYEWGDFVEPNSPYFSSVLDARKLGAAWPSNNLTPRGIILNLGNKLWACFDLDLLRIAAVWEGTGVTPVSMAQGSYHVPGFKAPEGQATLPQIIGTPWLANGIYPGWQMATEPALADPRSPCPDPGEVGRGPLAPEVGHFQALRQTAEGLCLEYAIGETAIQQWFTSALENGSPRLVSKLIVQPHSKNLILVLGKLPAQLDFRVETDSDTDKPLVSQFSTPEGMLALRLRPDNAALQFRFALGKQLIDVPPISKLPLNKRWPETVVTKGALSRAPNAFVVDNIALPLDNPWRRNVRLADLAFFKDGRAAAMTFDGDIWLISGLKGDLQEVRWRRFASGLHEPLSLCIRNEEIFVFDRNGVWRLRDTDGDGEADVQELFCNQFAQTAETREFATSMKLAPDGSFVICKGGQEGSTTGKQNGMVLRISPDGRSVTELAYGLRQAFLGINPKTGLITASDQQGHYVPATPLHIIRNDQFYGFISQLLPKEKYPAPIADPLTWIPHPINASGASQVWLTDARMGPLDDQLIHLGYYRPELFLVLLNERARRLQASVVSVTRDFEFAPLNGAVNPTDGQLYVTGFQIWGTTAKQISGLARVRFTGAPCLLPREVVPMDKGIFLKFDVSLERSSATDPANFSAERWNYKRTANYGSPHFKTNGSKGQDNMTPSSAYLSKDGKSVFVGIPGMQPVMQMRLGWALKATGGQSLEQNAYFTPYELTRFDPAVEGFGSFTVDLTPRAAASQAAIPQTTEEGKKVAELMGCVACHSADGSTLGKVGPSWKGLFGRERKFSDGTKAIADELYIRQSIREPQAKIVAGFDKSDTGMPSYEGVLSDGQIGALLEYIKSIK